jgi:diguanylate cyclase (GGDEF)-like protein/PAS domain S-box-containing protein
MRRELRKMDRRSAGMWIAWGVVLALAALAGLGLAWSERSYTIGLERQRMAEQTRVIGLNLARQLGAVRSVLADVRATMARHGDGCGGACRHAAMHALRGAMPGVRMLMLVERDGTIAFADADAGPGEPGKARYDFLGSPDALALPDTMYLSARGDPAGRGREVRAALPLAPGPHARAGILVAILDPAYFDVAMRSALYAPDMTSAVIDDGGTRLLFVPYDRSLPLYDAPGHTAFHVRHLRSGLASTFMQGPLGRDAEPRLVAQRTLVTEGFKLDRTLVVSVSRSEAAVDQPWRYLAWECAIAWTLLAAAGSVALALLQRRRRWMREILARQEAERAAAAERIDLALGGANLGLWDWYLDSGRLRTDARGRAMLGYEPGAGGEAPVFERWLEQVHPEDRGGIEQARARSDASSGYEAEYRVRHRDGHWIWVLSRGKVVERDEAGKALRMAGTHMDVSARKQAEEDIVRLAFYDGLTGLPNRRLLCDRLTQALAKSERSKVHGAVLFLDLDNFKSLNDSLGHLAGDKLLKRVAARLTEATRETDTVARLGGDEFVILLEHLGSSRDEALLHAERVGRKIVGVLGQHYTIDGHEVRSTPSVGIALFGAGTRSMDELLKQADMAMYEAKAAGRNAYRLFDRAMQAGLDHSVVLESELRRALAERQFVLFYQPVFDHAGRMVGVEALVRWKHPRKGLVGPGEFIAQSEKSDLIVEIGQWVLEEACRQLAAWRRHDATRTLTVAVNISARQARKHDFVDRVIGTLKATGADPSLLKLELTESMLLGNVDDMIGKMRALKARGIGFALDDFGTGYSSLSYLERLPITQLKVDRSFVRNMLVTPNAATIVRAVIALGHDLGLEVVAEGVENEDQQRALSAWGCSRFQGFLYSPPVAASELERWLAPVPAPLSP